MYRDSCKENNNHFSKLYVFEFIIILIRNIICLMNLFESNLYFISFKIFCKNQEFMCGVNKM